MPHDISDFGKCLGYDNEPCPNCGELKKVSLSRIYDIREGGDEGV